MKEHISLYPFNLAVCCIYALKSAGILNFPTYENYRTYRSETNNNNKHTTLTTSNSQT